MPTLERMDQFENDIIDVEGTEEDAVAAPPVDDVINARPNLHTDRATSMVQDLIVELRESVVEHVATTNRVVQAIEASAIAAGQQIESVEARLAEAANNEPEPEIPANAEENSS